MKNINYYEITNIYTFHLKNVFTEVFNNYDFKLLLFTILFSLGLAFCMNHMTFGLITILFICGLIQIKKQKYNLHYSGQSIENNHQKSTHYQ